MFRLVNFFEPLGNSSNLLALLGKILILPIFSPSSDNSLDPLGHYGKQFQ